MKGQDAFTLIELLVVISIIGIVSTLVVMDFGGARRSQTLALFGDQILALMQQSHSNVQAGHFEGEAFLCEGAYFEEGAVPLKAQAVFEEGECVSPAKEAYGMVQEEVEVSGMEVGEVPMEKVWAFFVPPDGHVEFYDEGGAPSVGDAKIDFEHAGDESLALTLMISYLTHQVSLATPKNE